MESAEDVHSELDRRIAERLGLLRAERGWTLDELARASGISKANLSRLEKGQVSPTASTLGKLCSAYGLTMSRLLALAEQREEVVLRRKDQQVWTDPSGGFRRTAVSTSDNAFECDVIEGELQPGAEIAYDAPPRPGAEHHIYCLQGELGLSVNGKAHQLKAGDSLKYRLHGASSFRSSGRAPARYIVVVK